MYFGPIGDNLKYKNYDYVYMTYETVCSPFFWNCDNILHLNVSTCVRKSKFLDLVSFCDAVDEKWPKFN